MRDLFETPSTPAPPPQNNNDEEKMLLTTTIAVASAMNSFPLSTTTATATATTTTATHTTHELEQQNWVRRYMDCTLAIWVKLSLPHLFVRCPRPSCGLLMERVPHTKGTAATLGIYLVCSLACFSSSSSFFCHTFSTSSILLSFCLFFSLCCWYRFLHQTGHWTQRPSSHTAGRSAHAQQSLCLLELLLGQLLCVLFRLAFPHWFNVRRVCAVFGCAEL